MTRAKGSAIIGNIDFAVATLAPDASDRIMQEVRAHPLASTLKNGSFIRSEWYPFELYMVVANTIERIWGKSDGELYFHAGEWIAERDLKSIYRVFLRFLHPEVLVNKSGQAWSQYYDSGTLHVTNKTASSVEFELANFPAPNIIHCQSIVGWATRGIVLSGKRDAHGTHVQCRARGDARCVSKIVWDRSG